MGIYEIIYATSAVHNHLAPAAFFQCLDPAGIEKPRVMKSPSFCFVLPVENKLFRLSFEPSFRRFAFSCSSANTSAVSEAAAAFLIPLASLIVPLDFRLALAESTGPLTGTTSDVARPSAAAGSKRFFRFLPEPETFLSECVRPCSLKRCDRSVRRFFSEGRTGSMVMMFSIVNGSLHCRF